MTFKTKADDEKQQESFQLLRYFSTFSFVAFAAIAIVLWVFNRQIAVNQLIELGEAKNVALAQTFSNSLWTEFAPFLTSLSGLSGDEIRARPETERLRQAVIAHMTGLTLIKLKIYNLEGLTVFSSQENQIGADKSLNEGFLSALDGKVMTDLSHRDTFDAFEGEVSDRDVIFSYAPITSGQDSPIEGVLEVYDDVTPLLERIERTQRNLSIGITAILAVLYSTLFLIVKYANNTMAHHREALRQNELRYRTVFNGVNDAIFVETLSGQILDVNERACEMFGWPRAEFLTKTVRDMVPLENRALIPDEQTEADISDEAFETVNIRADGERFPVAITGRIEAIGDQKRLLVVVRDITEQKGIEFALIAAKEAAETANQAKAEFLANMSHEIRTPLNAIFGMTSLLLDTPLNAEQQEFLETVRGGSDTLLAVINNILDYSKLEAGKIDLEHQPFYVRDCVETALDLVAEKAADKMLDLAYFIEPDMPPVVIGDSTHLCQILVNMLSNAVKFTQSGEVVVRVKTKPITADRHEMQFSVRDTGIGIPADKLDRLFKSFSQVDSSTTRKYGGTGLGLAISSKLAESMGGKMWVESDAGKGSTFYLTMLVDVKAGAKHLTAHGIQPRLEGKRVLIVDDNATNRLILIKQTESWGMKPQAVASGKAALALLEEKQRFDVAILDMQMPEMDGFTLVDEIEAICREKIFPVIILSSMGRNKLRSSDRIVTAFLNKPIKTSNLFDVLLNTVELAPVRVQQAKKMMEIDQSLGSRHPLRILLAEDNPINQKVALHILKRFGYQADLAGNGVEVLQALERQTYDVVLMDIQMPEMDGDEASRKIREDWPKDRQPHIIAMTAHALKGDREKFLSMGMDDYVSKPIQLEELIQALEAAKPLDT